MHATSQISTRFGAAPARSIPPANGGLSRLMSKVISGLAPHLAGSKSQYPRWCERSRDLGATAPQDCAAASRLLHEWSREQPSGFQRNFRFFVSGLVAC